MSTKKIFITFIIGFLILSATDFANGNISAIDSLIAAILISGALYLSGKYKIRPMAAFFFSMIFVPNSIGHFWGYSQPLLGYHYDWIVHFFVPIFAILAIATFFYDNKILQKPASSAIVAFLLIMTMGSFIETTEYWGFIFIGIGGGYLGFGDGDNSQNYGPWENSSLDQTFNLASGILAVLIFLAMTPKIEPQNKPEIAKKPNKKLY